MSTLNATGGKRRIDRVLSPEFVSDLAELTLVDLRARRQEADQEEVDLSYVRRLLQGHADIAQAELDRRAQGGAAQGPATENDDEMVSRLSHVLGDEGHDRPSAQGLGRYRQLEPSRVGESRRVEEALVAASGMAAPAGLTDSQLLAQLAELGEQEHAVSAQRKLVQAVLDQLSGEVTRRYRDGSASVDALLSE